MNNVWGLILSFVLVFLVIGISTVLEKKKILNDEQSRKFIHIGVSNWWFLVLFLFDNLWWAIIPPIIFIGLNYASYKMNLIKSMERSGNGNLGTVYFPIALLLLVIASFTFTNVYVGAIGIFILGYGDGLAAVVGKAFGKKKIINGKSLIGSITMFFASFIVSSLLLAIGLKLDLWMVLLFSFAISVISTLIELFTPKGLDNLSIPLGSSLLIYLLLMII